MPTAQDWIEISRFATWTDNYHGSGVAGELTNGAVITGPSGGSIFLPACGAFIPSALKYYGSECEYWLRSWAESAGTTSAFTWMCTSSTSSISILVRYCGASIRGVLHP